MTRVLALGTIHISAHRTGDGKRPGVKPGPWTPSKGHNRPLSALERSRIRWRPHPREPPRWPSCVAADVTSGSLSPLFLGQSPWLGLSTYSGERKVPGEKEARE